MDDADCRSPGQCSAPTGAVARVNRLVSSGSVMDFSRVGRQRGLARLGARTGSGAPPLQGLLCRTSGARACQIRPPRHLAAPGRVRPAPTTRASGSSNSRFGRRCPDSNRKSVLTEMPVAEERSARVRSPCWRSARRQGPTAAAGSVSPPALCGSSRGGTRRQGLVGSETNRAQPAP